MRAIALPSAGAKKPDKSKDSATRQLLSIVIADQSEFLFIPCTGDYKGLKEKGSEHAPMSIKVPPGS